MTKIDELLAVLDMPEEEQKAWIREYCDRERIDNTTSIPHPELGCEDYEIEISLAGLAFRLRDEVKELKYRSFDDTEGYSLDYAWREVYEYVTHKKWDYGFRSWMIKMSQPIHWIIAALIAKELAKEKTDEAMKTRYKYIHFEQTILNGFWNCINNKSKTVLGVVSYYKPWKRFVFNAEDPSNIFSQDCLADIIDFLKQL